MSFLDRLEPRINDMHSNKSNFDSFRKFFCIEDGFNFDVQGLMGNINNLLREDDTKIENRVLESVVCGEEPRESGFLRKSKLLN